MKDHDIDRLIYRLVDTGTAIILVVAAAVIALVTVLVIVIGIFGQ